MQPQLESPRAELKRLEGELNFERGVSHALEEVSKGVQLEEIVRRSAHRTAVLMARYERLKERIK